jgi:hypothetical protein
MKKLIVSMLLWGILVLVFGISESRKPINALPSSDYLNQTIIGILLLWSSANLYFVAKAVFNGIRANFLETKRDKFDDTR